MAKKKLSIPDRVGVVGSRLQDLVEEAQDILDEYEAITSEIHPTLQKMQKEHNEANPV